MLGKETIREEVWIRAFEASSRRGSGLYSAIEDAKTCLEDFDKTFPQHSSSSSPDFPFPLNDGF